MGATFGAAGFSAAITATETNIASRTAFTEASIRTICGGTVLGGGRGGNRYSSLHLRNAHAELHAGLACRGFSFSIRTRRRSRSVGLRLDARARRRPLQRGPG